MALPLQKSHLLTRNGLGPHQERHSGRSLRGPNFTASRRFSARDRNLSSVAPSRVLHSLVCDSLVMFIVLVGPGMAALSAGPHLAEQVGQSKDKVENQEPSVQRQRTLKRLILKDGSYLLINKFEIDGRQVRYLSSERHTWEEVPFSLVDWTETAKYAQEAALEKQARIEQSAEAEAKDVRRRGKSSLGLAWNSTPRDRRRLPARHI